MAVVYPVGCQFGCLEFELRSNAHSIIHKHRQNTCALTCALYVYQVSLLSGSLSSWLATDSVGTRKAFGFAPLYDHIACAVGELYPELSQAL